ncbi:MAG TPA: ATP-binding protein [Acidimicrobiia bacterium]|nr:ATP-binding protein [Acidimicrobiia bacterium]
MTPVLLLRAELPACPTSVGTARHAVTTELRAAGLDDLTDVATLLTSELATNAVRHARTRFRLSVERDGPCLRVEVTDASDEPRRVSPSDPLHDPVTPEPGGLGLALVTALATRWGFEQRRGDGEVVWFELAAS